MQEVNSGLNFEEQNPGLLSEQAFMEAKRCLYCFDAPCVKGCPVGIDIPGFIQAVKSGNLKRASRLIYEKNPFGAVCGRVCPVDRLCQQNCNAKQVTGRSVNIGLLQRYATDQSGYDLPPVKEDKDLKVAVVGAGPSGLACARELALNGYQVTVFESKSKAGGMVAFGVPQYRCSHKVTAKEVEYIKRLGVEIKTATPVNQNVSRLFEQGYRAVYLAVGLTKTTRPEMDGLNLKGVYMGLDFLTRIGSGDTPDVGKKVIVVGGGDTALDCARSALRLGAEEVSLMYRRSFAELPAERVEIDEAVKEGVIFRTLTQPKSLKGDDENILRAVECANIKLGPPDDSGRRKPVEIGDSTYRLACNTMIFATGFEPSGLLKKILPDVQYEKDLYPRVDGGSFSTTMPGVFCGGDMINGGATVVEAVANGIAAANGIIDYIEATAREFAEFEEEISRHEETNKVEDVEDMAFFDDFETPAILDNVGDSDVPTDFEDFENMLEDDIYKEEVSEEKESVGLLFQGGAKKKDVVAESPVRLSDVGAGRDLPEREMREKIPLLVLDGREEDPETARKKEELKNKWKDKFVKKNSNIPVEIVRNKTTEFPEPSGEDNGLATGQFPSGELSEDGDSRQSREKKRRRR